MDVQARLSGVCKLFAKALKQIEKDIRDKERRVRALGDEIGDLQRQPKPDQAKIQELAQRRQELESELETDRSQLGAFQEEFSASCSG
jgi:chromosome segregation ATPase